MVPIEKMPLISCRDIRFQYPGAENVLFDELTFSIQRPGFHALFGPSGIGKTTLAKIISGDIRAPAGQVEISGAAPCLYTYNRERLPGWSSVGRHLEKSTPKGRESVRDDLIPVFGLAELMGMRFSTLSLGQCNRVNLLRYLLQDFGLLIMDESLANVDEPTRQTILYKIKSTFPENGFLYISHNVVEVARFCDQIIVLRGAHKSPRIQCVDGRDHKEGHPLDDVLLEASMLEIVNAA